MTSCTFRKFYKITKKLEVTGFLVKTSKVAKSCIMVFVGSKIEIVSSVQRSESEKIWRP